MVFGASGPGTVACSADEPSTAHTLAFVPAGGVSATVTANQTITVNF